MAWPRTTPLACSKTLHTQYGYALLADLAILFLGGEEHLDGLGSTAFSPCAVLIILALQDDPVAGFQRDVLAGIRRTQRRRLECGLFPRRKDFGLRVVGWYGAIVGGAMRRATSA